MTKVWPKADYPLIEVGVMELNRYPENYFAEVEQAAFSPANMWFQELASLLTRCCRSAVLLWRYPTIPPRSQLQSHPCECAEVPIPLLSPGWPDAHRWQPGSDDGL
jgi:hypothetical protein